MPVDARRRFELYAACEPHFGETTAAFMEFLREVAEDPEWQRFNHQRFKRTPEKTYRLYAALRRTLGAEAALTVMEILDPIGSTEEWPPSVPPADRPT
jgi:hypothetical protein